MPWAGQAANAPGGLLCQLMEHPEQSVITAVTPGLGWEYNPSFRNDTQAGYRIIVASSAALANAGTGDLWDSGMVSSGVSINVPYGGATLQPGASYYWRVQTQDGAGQVSGFSAVQQFNMDTQLGSAPVAAISTNGLKWIWYPGETNLPGARYFRKTFTVSSVAGAQILLTADDQFALYVNGASVGTGNNVNQFGLFSLTALIQPGTNLVAVVVTNIGATAAGLTGRVDYRGADGSTNTVYVDGSWLASQTGPAGWNQPGFDDSAWPSAAVLGNFGLAPWGTTPALPHPGVIFNSSANTWANRYQMSYTPVLPVLITNTGPGQWFIDFGQDAFGYATVHLNGANLGQVVATQFGEMSNGLAVNATPPSGSTVRYATNSFALTNGDVVYAARPPSFSGQAVSPPTATYGVVMPFRYLGLANVPGTLTATDVVQQVLLYPFNTNAASFNSSSAAMNQVWALCRNSMRVLGFDGVYVDGDRERTPYEADSYIHQLSSYAVDREFTMVRYSFGYLLQHPTWPTEWKSHMIFIAWADYLQTGNTDMLYAYYDALKPYMFLYRAGANGLMQGFPNFPQTTNSDIVDWPAGDRDGFVINSGSYLNKTNTVVNSFYYRCLQTMANIATVIGETNDAATFNADAAQVYNSFNAVLWNSASQNYRDGLGTNHSAAHANFFPLAFGLVPASNQTAVLNYIHSRITADNGMPPSVYGAQYLLQALFQVNDADTALGLMTTNGTRGWLNMLAIGSTVTAEAWSFTDKPNMDWNHAWGAAAGNLIQNYVLGLRPLTPGCGQMVIQPQLGTTLSFVQGTVPTIRGPVSIQVTNGAGNYQMLLNIPGNMTMTVMLPTLGASNATALVDGAQVTSVVSNGWLTVSNIGSGQHAVWLNTAGAPPQATLYSNWAWAYFGNQATNPTVAGQTVDADGDGVNNFNEFVAGTDPTDPKALFQVTEVTLTNGPVFTVPGVAGRYYTLLRSASLPSAGWSMVMATDVLNSNQPLQLSDPAPLTGQAYYRVQVTLP